MSSTISKTFEPYSPVAHTFDRPHVVIIEGATTMQARSAEHGELHAAVLGAGQDWYHFQFRVWG